MYKSFNYNLSNVTSKSSIDSNKIVKQQIGQLNSFAGQEEFDKTDRAFGGIKFYAFFLVSEHSAYVGVLEISLRRHSEKYNYFYCK